jgi:hypothetical protein
MLLTLEASLAVTVPCTGVTSAALNQPFSPLTGLGKLTVTVGGVVSVGAGAQAPVLLTVAETVIGASRVMVFPSVFLPVAR